ncbi:MAG: NAD(+)/NADH kinase [Candidatus Margulisbacteria bacterium]|nr:NAD(+)/NADH kinase [Candidatus Margulisiibacteriota bacterium]
MKTIGIISKIEDRLIAATADKVAKEIKAMGIKVDLAKADLVVTLGGDGTILRAARLLAKKGIPILSVHLGGVGFLSELELKGLKGAIEKIRAGEYQLDERAMLEAEVGRRKLLALNDVVIGKSGISRVIKFELERISRYTADGMIFATATGSTAYNLAAGGPLLAPQATSIIISPICCHSLNTRSLVLDGPAVLRLTRGDEVILTADGQQKVPVKVGDRVVIKRAAEKTRFIRLRDYDFFGRVRETFGLGEN